MTSIHDIIKSMTDGNAIESVYWVGCGASRSDLYLGYYFLNNESHRIKTSLHTAKEFVLTEPASLDEHAIVIACSLAGATPETVEAVSYARSRGAHVIALTHEAESALTKDAEKTVVFTWGDTYSSKLDKQIKVLQLAVEILHEVEGYELYDTMTEGLSRIGDLAEETVAAAQKPAAAFAEKYKDTPILYVTSSGPMEQIAWSFCQCLMMEMQHIPSSTFNTGDFFHGPFERVKENVDYLLLMNDGRTRPMDERALAFMERFHTNVTVVDVKDFGLTEKMPARVAEYLNPIIISPTLRIYAEHIAELRNHPLTYRSYMWKMEY